MNEIDIGRKAKEILRLMDEIELVERTENAITRMWIESSSSDAEGREELYREGHGLRSLIVRLNADVTAGVFKEKE